jgi:hypothetical protein
MKPITARAAEAARSLASAWPTIAAAGVVVALFVLA